MLKVEDTIKENALSGIKKVSGDQGSTEMHPLPDQIEADRYLKSQKAGRRGFGGIRLVQFIPPGNE